MSAEPSAEPPPERGAAGLMLAALIGAAVLCAGTVGGVGYFTWRAARNVADRAREAEANAELARRMDEEREREAARAQFERVARAVADGLKDPAGLSDSFAPDGRPLLSWRVHLLPRLGHADLYRRFKRDEPWDGPTNKALLGLIPTEYDYHGPRKERADGWTYVRGFTHPGAVFEPGARVAPKDFPLGPDETLATFDGAPVEWTRPDGLAWKPGEPRPRFGGSLDHLGEPAGAFLAATAAGRVVRVKGSVPDDVLRQLFDRRRGPGSARLTPALLD